jgi:type III secretory pathway lipoprotein EscJ
MNQASGATVGAQKQLGNMMERYLLAMNMPSRAQMVDMAERLQSIEGHLNDIKTLLQQMNAVNGMTRDSVAVALKPPRTKRPPQPAAELKPPRVEPKQPPGEKK